MLDDALAHLQKLNARVRLPPRVPGPIAYGALPPPSTGWCMVARVFAHVACVQRAGLRFRWVAM